MTPKALLCGQPKTEPQPEAQLTRSPQEESGRRAWGGILVRTERWGLSWSGKLLAAAVCVGALVIAIQCSYPFLAITRPAHGQFLVVEGWVHTDGLREAFAEFNKGGYLKILTTGTMVRSEWDPRARVTYAEWAASKFARIGASNALVEAVPCWVEHKDRTYHSALALKQWFLAKGITAKSIDVVTEGPHARRTRLLYQKALGSQVSVGIISVEDKEYDRKHWWRSSEGVREVVGEAIAYLYARIFFHPSTSGTEVSLNNAPKFGIFPAAVIAVWFFKTAKAGRKNPWRAFLVGAVSSYGGYLFASVFLHAVGLSGLLSGFLLEAAVTIGSLAGGALVAASVHANLYSEGRPTVSDILAVCVMLAGAFLSSLLFH
jgi:hypothetical protein